MTTTAFLFIVGTAIGAQPASRAAAIPESWPSWRGPSQTGAATATADPPISWSETGNVRFKVPLPGRGLSTPIVWADQLFLTTAIPHGEPVAAEASHDHIDGAHDNLPPTRNQRYVVLSYDRNSGAVNWQTTVHEARPHESTHETGSWASPSAVTDGERLIASFGSQGLYALDLDSGKLLWQRDLGDMKSRHGHGEGSSPALHGDTLVVNWDHQGESFVTALDVRTGKERWKVARDEITSWSTPIVVEHDGKLQVVIAATRRTSSYDLATGEVLWECGGLSRNVVASPVAGDGMVFVANSYDFQAMLAIRLEHARGDITDSTKAIPWRIDRHTPYVPSPLLYGGRLYFLKHSQAFLSALDAATGKPAFGPVRIPGIRNIFASPVGAGGRVYIPSRSGATAVVRAGDEFELLAVNRLDDSFSASPAVIGDSLYLRGERSLYRIAAP